MKVKSLDLIKDDLPAQIVRVADKVEYINYDFDELMPYLRFDFRNIEDGIRDYMLKPVDQRIQITVDELVNEVFRHNRIDRTQSPIRSLARLRKLYESVIYLYDGEYSNKIKKVCKYEHKR